MKKTIKDAMRADYGSASVSTRGGDLEFDFDPVRLSQEPAKAIAQEFKRDVTSSPRSWNKTGYLAQGIRADRVGPVFKITAPPGRLQDPRLRERFAAEIPAMTDDVTQRPSVVAALLAALRVMVKKK